MNAPARPPEWSEADRLAALDAYGILDTPREVAFDEIAQLAAQICEAPSATVTFVVDTRQWFKATVGVNARETEIGVSVCAHAIRQRDLFVVPDTTKDPRFASNPLVTGPPFLRFYAGAVLQSAEGVPIGTLCVLDYHPRDLTDWQAFSLKALARQVMTQLELRRMLREQNRRERHNRLIVESAVDYAIVSIDLAGLVTSWNEGARRLLGWSADEAIGRNMAAIFTSEGEDDARSRIEIEAALLSGRTQDERWYRRRDGSRFWGVGELTPLADDDGAPQGFVKILRDRTERRRTEEAVETDNRRLAAESERLRSLFEQAPGFMAMLREPNHVFELANSAFFDLVGRRDLIGKTVPEVLPELAGLAFVKLLDAVWADGEPFVAHGVRVHLDSGPDGQSEEHFLDFVLQPIFDAAGAVSGIFVEGSDVSEREHVAAALARSRERLRIAQRAGQIGTFEWDPDSREVAYSAEYSALWGLGGERGVMSIEAMRELIHAEDRAGVRTLNEDVDISVLDYCEYRIVKPDTGETRWIARRGEMVREQGTERLRGFGVVYDITERKRIEAELIGVNALLAERVVESTRERDRIWSVSQDLLLIVDQSGSFLAVNPAWERTLGWSEADLLGQSAAWLLHPDDPAQSFTDGEAPADGAVMRPFENRLRHRDGSYRWLSWTAVPERGLLYCVARDVTTEREAAEALRQTEEALRQAHKMEAVGQLTGGIAHDFNNILTGITGSLDIMQTRLRQGRVAEIDRYISSAAASANRAAALTHRLLAFARRQPLDPKPVDVRVLVASMEDLFRRTIGEAITMNVVSAPDLWLTRCDPNQLESAFLNLVINARDAMPAGGTLTLESRNLVVTAAEARAARELDPGEYVAITVGDTGTGMSEAVMSHAFEPFFTTKPLGQGTGLGLSMIYGFTRQSEGHVDIESTLGEGTRVTLYLPRLASEAPDAAISDPLAPDAAAKGRTLLVIEDEPIVRELVMEVLVEEGYRVLEAADGPSGLRLLIERGAEIDLLVTDVGLPGLNGRDVVDQARRTLPDLRVLFITGYAEGATMAEGFLQPGMELLTKPFAIDALTERVRTMLEPGYAR